jgi:hypothetical protein
MKISWSNIVEEAIGGILVLAIWGLLSYLFNLIIKNNNAQIIIWLIPLVIILISVRILGWPTIRKWIAVLGRSILNNLWLVIGLSLLVGVVLGVFWLTNSYWFILLTGVFAIALISMEFWFYRILSSSLSERKAGWHQKQL